MIQKYSNYVRVAVWEMDGLIIMTHVRTASAEHAAARGCTIREKVVMEGTVLDGLCGTSWAGAEKKLLILSY